MPTKKKSIPTWVKAHNGGWGRFFDTAVEAVTTFCDLGDHPDIEWTGDGIGLATGLYLEYAKKAGAQSGLYCTRPEVALAMARSLELQPGQIVLNPGSGLHALTLAVRAIQPEAKIICVECQNWLASISQAVGLPVVPCDFDSYTPAAKIDAVIVNPSWGKLWGSNQYEVVMMERVAAITETGTRIAALLPGQPGHFWGKLKNGNAWLKSALIIKEEAYYQGGAALPKSLPCTRYLFARA